MNQSAFASKMLSVNRKRKLRSVALAVLVVFLTMLLLASCFGRSVGATASLPFEWNNVVRFNVEEKDFIQINAGNPGKTLKLEVDAKVKDIVVWNNPADYSKTFVLSGTVDDRYLRDWCSDTARAENGSYQRKSYSENGTTAEGEQQRITYENLMSRLILQDDREWNADCRLLTEGDYWGSDIYYIGNMKLRIPTVFKRAQVNKYSDGVIGLHATSHMWYYWDSYSISSRGLVLGTDIRSLIPSTTDQSNKGHLFVDLWYSLASTFSFGIDRISRKDQERIIRDKSCSFSALYSYNNMGVIGGGDNLSIRIGSKDVSAPGNSSSSAKSYSVVLDRDIRFTVLPDSILDEVPNDDPERESKWINPWEEPPSASQEEAAAEQNNNGNPSSWVNYAPETVIKPFIPSVSQGWQEPGFRFVYFFSNALSLVITSRDPCSSWWGSIFSRVYPSSAGPAGLSPKCTQSVGVSFGEKVLTDQDDSNQDSIFVTVQRSGTSDERLSSRVLLGFNVLQDYSIYKSFYWKGISIASAPKMSIERAKYSMIFKMMLMVIFIGWSLHRRDLENAFSSKEPHQQGETREFSTGFFMMETTGNFLSLLIMTMEVFVFGASSQINYLTEMPSLVIYAAVYGSSAVCYWYQVFYWAKRKKFLSTIARASSEARSYEESSRIERTVRRGTLDGSKRPAQHQQQRMGYGFRANNLYSVIKNLSFQVKSIVNDKDRVIHFIEGDDSESSPAADSIKSRLAVEESEPTEFRSKHLNQIDPEVITRDNCFVFLVLLSMWMSFMVDQEYLEDLIYLAMVTGVLLYNTVKYSTVAIILCRSDMKRAEGSLLDAAPMNKRKKISYRHGLCVLTAILISAMSILLSHYTLYPLMVLNSVQKSSFELQGFVYNIEILLTVSVVAMASAYKSVLNYF